MDGVKNGTVVGKRMTSNKRLGWQNFNLIFYAINSEKYLGYAMCQSWKMLLKHDRAKSGTTYLHVHRQSCKASITESSSSSKQSQPKVTSYFNKQSLPVSAKKDLINACMQYVATDLRPLNSLEGKRLLNLLQTCIKLGAKYGNMSTDVAIPSRHSVKRKLGETASGIKSNLCEKVITAITENGLNGLTSDMWSDLKMRHFLSLTVHNVSQSQLHARILTVYEFPMLPKTRAGIKQSIENTWSSLGLPVEALVEKLLLCHRPRCQFPSCSVQFYTPPMYMSYDWNYCKTHIAVRQLKQVSNVNGRRWLWHGTCVTGKLLATTLLLYRKRACWKVRNPETARTNSKGVVANQNPLLSQLILKTTSLKRQQSHKTRSQDSHKTQAKAHDD